MPKRILVTGSRSFPYADLIERDLTILAEKWPEDTILVHGDCPTGADAIAERVWTGLGRKTEKHPADWEKYAKYAGPKRNKEMVELGADLCLAYPTKDSKGTKHCIEEVKKAGIPYVVNYGNLEKEEK